MLLKTKFVLMLLTIFFLFTAVDFITSRFLVFPSFAELENDEALKNSERSVRAVKREIHYLDALCHDWSAWDETYAFAEKPYHSYAEANLLMSSFVNNNLNLIYICNKDRKVVWGEIYDLNTLQPVHLADFPKQEFPEKHPLIPEPSEEIALENFSISGIYMTEQGPMMIASRPILNSNNEGPSRGTFLMGRFLNENIISLLIEQTQVNFRIFLPEMLPQAFRNKVPHLKPHDPPYISHDKGDEHLLIFTAFPDILRNTAFLIQSESPKKICAVGATALTYAFFSSIAAGAAVIVFVLLLMQQTILGPVANLTKHVLSVGASGDLSKRLSVTRKDEIGMLETEFDRMLAKLEEQSAELANINEQLKADIAKREQIEDALRKSEKYYRMLLYSMHEEIIVADREHIISDANKDFLETAGRDREEVIGQHCFNVYPGFQELFERLEDHKLQKVFLTGRSYSCRYKHHAPDGSVRYSDLLLSPLTDESAEVTHVIIAMRDVTIEARLEKQFRQIQKMEAVGTLAGGIAHDFNNILMSVMMNIEFAVKKSQGNLSVCESLELSLKGCYRARDLVEQMLTFSRKSKQEQMPLIISPIIRESLKMLERTLPTDIRLHQHIGAASAAVLATPTQIHQIVFNLCINAAHAMRKNAEAPARKTDKPALLSVSLQEDFIDADTVQVHPKIDPGPYLRLTVKDTGHGIPPEIMDRIFDPFFTTKNPGEGTGMGLAVVHGILKGIRGGVRVESAPDKGSVFDVFLPVFEGGKKFDSTDKSPALLIVDDKAFLSETLQNSHHSKF